MIIAVKYESIVEENGLRHADTSTAPRLRAGALDALRALKRAGHVLVLTSPRANLALRSDPMLDPLVAAGVQPFDRGQWQRSRPIHQARYEEMRRMEQTVLGGLFAAVDDGRQGPIAADMTIDPHAVRMGHGAHGAKAWSEIAATWGDVRYAPPQRKRS